MKIKKPKRIMSLFLAALMCVTSLVGTGTTAYAAEETEDVYPVSYTHLDVYKRQPFGFALKGHKVGETVTVAAPVGELQFKIIAVENEN